MNSLLSGNDVGLVGYWDFNEGIGDIAYDKSQFENQSTISGATWSSDTPNCRPNEFHSYTNYWLCPINCKFHRFIYGEYYGIV